VQLAAKGFTLSGIWENMIEQVALYEEKAEETAGLSLNERLKLQEQIEKLQKQIDKTEATVWKEQQPKKRFELYTQLQAYKTKMEELKHGQ